MYSGFKREIELQKLKKMQLITTSNSTSQTTQYEEKIEPLSSDESLVNITRMFEKLLEMNKIITLQPNQTQEYKFKSALLQEIKLQRERWGR